MATVTARGVCWSTTANPTIANSHTTDGSGTGVFTSNITGLTANALYHVRAYATNSTGTAYGEDLTFTATTYVTYLTKGLSLPSLTEPPSCRTKTFQTGTVEWQRSIGDSISGDTAHGGTYNAMLYIASTGNHETYLITPQLNLAGVTSTNLEFWHKQTFWNPDQDTLVVYYKTSSGGAWTHWRPTPRTSPPGLARRLPFPTPRQPTTSGSGEMPSMATGCASMTW